MPNLESAEGIKILERIIRKRKKRQLLREYLEEAIIEPTISNIEAEELIRRNNKQADHDFPISPIIKILVNGSLQYLTRPADIIYSTLQLSKIKAHIENRLPSILGNEDYTREKITIIAKTIKGYHRKAIDIDDFSEDTTDPVDRLVYSL